MSTKIDIIDDNFVLSIDKVMSTCQKIKAGRILTLIFVFVLLVDFVGYAAASAHHTLGDYVDCELPLKDFLKDFEDYKEAEREVEGAEPEFEIEESYIHQFVYACFLLSGSYLTFQGEEDKARPEISFASYKEVPLFISFHQIKIPSIC